MKKIILVLLISLMMLTFISCENATDVQKSLIQTHEAKSFVNTGLLKWQLKIDNLTPLQQRKLNRYIWMVNGVYVEYKSTHVNEKAEIESILHLPLNEVKSKSWIEKTIAEEEKIQVITELNELSKSKLTEANQDKTYIIFDSDRYLEDKVLKPSHIQLLINKMLLTADYNKERAVYVGNEYYENQFVSVYKIELTHEDITNILLDIDEQLEKEQSENLTSLDFIGEEGVVVYFRVDEAGYLVNIDGVADCIFTVQEYLDLVSSISETLDFSQIPTEAVVQIKLNFTSNYTQINESKDLILPITTEENSLYYSDLKAGE